MQKLLIIGYTWPEPKTTGAGVRMMQLISFFLKNDFQITVASTAEKSSYSENLVLLGIQEQSLLLNDSTFNDFVKKLQPDFVLFDRFYTEEQFGWRVAEVCPNAMRILDTEDLHFLRKSREQTIKLDKNVPLIFSEVAKREMASIYRCDLSLIISEVEMKLLQNKFNVDALLLHYLPFLNQNKTISKETPTFEDRKHFIFIGNYKHQPNVDSVLELKNKIWPLISKMIPDAELHCFGAYASKQIEQLHKPDERFFVKGWVDDLQTTIENARVMLAPLRFGAGLKRKLIEAMQFGTPSLTTQIGSEGISDEKKWNGFILDDTIDFSEKAVQLYTNKSLWQKSQQKGFEILQNFNSLNFEGEFLEKIFSIKNNLESHRNSNFTGALLMYHTFQSTKYMSKWIEEKNKN